MFDYKKYLSEMVEDNKELIKDYAAKMGIIDIEPEDMYKDIEARCYRVLAENERLVVYGIDGEEYVLKKLYELFKDDQRVNFWVSEQMEGVIPVDGGNVWIKNVDAINPYSRPIFDYGDYRLGEKAKSISKFILIDDFCQSDESFGYIASEKKERNLCKLVSKFIKEEKEIVVFSVEEKSILYIKGLMKGAGVINKDVTFALLDGFQNDLIQSLKNDMYLVTPIVTIEKDRNWSVLTKKIKRYQKEIIEEIRKFNDK